MALKKIEEIVQVRPSLKGNIEGLISDKIFERNFRAINETLDIILGEQQNMLVLIVLCFQNPNFFEEYELDTHFSPDFKEWLSGLSVRFGWDISQLFNKVENEFDWRELNHKVVLGEEFLVQMNLERMDGKKFFLESSRRSVINLIRVLVSKLHLFPENQLLDEDEAESANKALSLLKGFIESNVSTDEDNEPDDEIWDDEIWDNEINDDNK